MTQATWNHDRRKGLDLVAQDLRAQRPQTQAERVVAKFGGPYRLSQALAQLPDPSMHRHASVIYRWLWSKSKSGRGGRIPLSAWDGIKLAARMQGILLTPEDMQP